jgi:hypothetical protein
MSAPDCSCAVNLDGTRTTIRCAVHAEQDPCYTTSQVTGRRRRGTIRAGRCTRCGWTEGVARATVAAFAAGVDAWRLGRPAAPALDPAVRDLLAPLAGSAVRCEVLAAWLAGWHSLNAAEGVAR